MGGLFELIGVQISLQTAKDPAKRKDNFVRNTIFTKITTRLAALLILTVCLMYMQGPPQAAALTCQQMCQAEASSCEKGCHGSEGCQLICAEALRGCLNG